VDMLFSSTSACSSGDNSDAKVDKTKISAIEVPAIARSLAQITILLAQGTAGGCQNRQNKYIMTASTNSFSANKLIGLNKYLKYFLTQLPH